MKKDISSVEEGTQNAIKYGLDGIMIGRAVFGNPWLFSPLHKNKKNNNFTEEEEKKEKENEISLEARLACMIEHTLLWESLLGRKKSFAFLKKHFRRYSPIASFLYFNTFN